MALFTFRLNDQKTQKDKHLKSKHTLKSLFSQPFLHLQPCQSLRSTLTSSIMQHFIFSLLSLFIAQAAPAAAWSTLYSSTHDLAYLHLSNNAVLQILADSANSPKSLPDPPANASLVLAKDNTLLAFYGTSFCSPIQVSKYSAADNAWTEISESLTNQPNYLAQSVYISSPDSELVYIYGGRNLTDSCSIAYVPDPSTIYDPQADYLVSNQIKVLNTTSLDFKILETPSSPTAMFAAGVLRLSSTSSLLVGGKAQNGWIGMNQLALWQYSSWAFISTSNSARVDSRTNPLVLPLKSPAGSVMNGFRGNATLVIGGRVNNHLSLPFMAGLTLNDSTGWTWNESLNQSIVQSPESILGAVAFENTLITIDGNSNSKKRAADYKLTFIDTRNWEQISGYTPSTSPSDTAVDSPTTSTLHTTATVTATSTSTAVAPDSGSTISSGGKIALSTVLPISAFALLAIGGVFFYRKRKREEDTLPAPRPLLLSPYFGSASTFENNILDGENRRTDSIKSWTEKRRMYEQQELQQFEQSQPYGHPYRQPYMALGDPYQTEPNASKDLGIISIGEGVNDFENPFYNIQDDHMEPPDAPPAAHSSRPVRTSTMRTVSGTIASYLLGRKMSTATDKTRPTSVASNYPVPATPVVPSAHPHADYDDEYDDDQDKFFEGRDVQVLVSSKRRTRLRVTNPDPDTLSRTNSEHSTIASLKIKKQRSVKGYGQLTYQHTTQQSTVRSASGSSISRHNSTSSVLRKTSVVATMPLTEEDTENQPPDQDLADTKIGARELSNRSTLN